MPACGGHVRIVAALTEPRSIQRYLEGVGLPSPAPPIALARPHPQAGAIVRGLRSVAVRAKAPLCPDPSLTTPEQDNIYYPWTKQRDRRTLLELMARGRLSVGAEVHFVPLSGSVEIMVSLGVTT